MGRRLGELEELHVKYERLNKRHMTLRKCIDPEWIAGHIQRCERDMAGAVLNAGAGVLSGEQASTVQSQSFTDRLWGAVFRAAELKPKDDLMLLAAARAIAGEDDWDAVAVLKAARDALEWHSEYYAVRLKEAWRLEDRRRRAVKRLLRLIESEDEYKWT